MLPPQLTEPIWLNLSRWRHGFEPRWDYTHKVPGQGTSPKSIGWLNRDSNAEYPANIPHRIERSDGAGEPASRGWMHSAAFAFMGMRRGDLSTRLALNTLLICSAVAPREPVRWRLKTRRLDEGLQLMTGATSSGEAQAFSAGPSLALGEPPTLSLNNP